MLREDEIFSAEAICSKFLATYRDGEDPPDIYISIDKKEIAIEISTLTEHVFTDSGNRISRLSQDTGIIRLCNKLDDELKRNIPNNIYFILTIPSPINKLRKFKDRLKDTIISISKGFDHNIDRKCIIQGIEARINVVKGERTSGKKVIGIILNKLSSEEKTKKCSNIHHKPLWLALFNDYWLADFDTYQKAFETLSINHNFDKILIINGSKNTYEINQT